MGPLLSRFWGAPILTIMPLNIIPVKLHEGYRHYGVLALRHSGDKVANLRRGDDCGGRRGAETAPAPNPSFRPGRKPLNPPFLTKKKYVMIFI